MRRPTAREPRKGEENVRVTAHLPPALLEAILHQAINERLNLSQMIEKMVREYLKKTKKGR